MQPSSPCTRLRHECPIVNPLDQGVKDAFTNAKLLLGFDKGALHFIQEAQDAPAAADAATPVQDLPPLAQVKAAVKQGEKEEAASAVKRAIEAGLSSEEIIQSGLTAAMTEIGDGYGAGKVFLPQVMMSAEAMQAAFKVIKEMLPEAATAAKGTLILGTVQGDIHDLGKNIVSAFLKTAATASSTSARTSPPKLPLCHRRAPRGSRRPLLPHDHHPSGARKDRFPRQREMPRRLHPDRRRRRHERLRCSIGADAYCKDGIAASKKPIDDGEIVRGFRLAGSRFRVSPLGVPSLDYE